MSHCTLPLPAGFRRADFLAFHGRDPSGVAEQVTTDSLRKGLLWQSRATCLELRFRDDHAEVRLDGDGSAALARRMLGLEQNIQEFEDTYCGHPDLGRLIAGQAGLRLPQTATPFEALAWAVTGQQISVGAAVSIRRRLIQTAGIRHDSGLLCPPEAVHILALGEDGLRGCGFSGGKARSLCEIARRVQDGRLNLDPARPAAELERELLDTPGIGPWTVSYTLLRGFGWLDGSLHGDAAVRRGLQSLLSLPERPDDRWTARWLAQFSPWRALLAAHLWAWQSGQGY